MSPDDELEQFKALVEMQRFYEKHKELWNARCVLCRAIQENILQWPQWRIKHSEPFPPYLMMPAYLMQPLGRGIASDIFPPGMPPRLEPMQHLVLVRDMLAQQVEAIFAGAGLPSSWADLDSRKDLPQINWKDVEQKVDKLLKGLGTSLNDVRKYYAGQSEADICRIEGLSDNDNAQLRKGLEEIHALRVAVLKNLLGWGSTLIEEKLRKPIDLPESPLEGIAYYFAPLRFFDENDIDGYWERARPVHRQISQILQEEQIGGELSVDFNWEQARRRIDTALAPLGSSLSDVLKRYQ